MSQTNRAKEVIKDYIRKSSLQQVRIPVADKENLAIFEQALRSPDIQRMEVQSGVSVVFYIPENLVEQAKRQMLRFIRTADAPTGTMVVFPYLDRDYADGLAALGSPEVQSALRSRGYSASVERVSTKPDIVIATVDDMASGKLDPFIEKFKDKD